jgi:PAS domain S-box-containing protein
MVTVKKAGTTGKRITGEGNRTRAPRLATEKSAGKETLKPYRGKWIQGATRDEIIDVLDRTPCGIFIVERPLGESLYINQEILKISGYDLADIPTARIARRALFSDSKTRRQQARFHEEMMRGSAQTPFLSHITRKDGTSIVCEVRCVDLGNRIMVGVWTDVTRREVAEEELRIREARFRSLFEESFDAVLLLEGDRIVDCNRATERLFQVPSRDALLGMGFRELVHEEDYLKEEVAAKAAQMASGLPKRKKLRVEGMLRRFDGEPFPAEITIISIRLQGKNVLHVMLRDITSLKAAERDLRAVKEGLEDRVRERTAELTRVNRELKQSREELRHLSEHLQRAREEERTFVAREIHDELGQLLTALKMDAAYCRDHLHGDTQTLEESLKAMEAQIDGGINTVRKICSDLRPHVLERLGLSAGIEWFVNGFAKRTGIRCSLSLSARIPHLANELALVLFRVLQEAMTNVARHAQATTLDVTLTARSEGLRLTVRDNGKGIAREEVESPESFGIIGIRERIRFRGGKSTFDRGKKGGTVVTVWLPLDGRKGHKGEVRDGGGA